MLTCLTPSKLASWYQFYCLVNRDTSALEACPELLVRKLEDSGFKPATLRSTGRNPNHTTNGTLISSGAISWTPRYRGEENLFLFSKNAQNHPTEFKKFPGDNAPDPRFRREEVLFQFSKNVPKLYYSNADFKNFPGDNTLDPVSGARKVCFCSPAMYQNSPTALQNSEIKSGGKTPGPPFL